MAEEGERLLWLQYHHNVSSGDFFAGDTYNYDIDPKINASCRDVRYTYIGCCIGEVCRAGSVYLRHSLKYDTPDFFAGNSKLLNASRDHSLITVKPWVKPYSSPTKISSIHHFVS